jgi:citrate lyase subunit beta/citryl-CoA lyase
MLERAQALPADQVFLDLEDAVAPDAKESARDNVVQAIREGDWGERTVAVRINDCSTRWALRDIERIVLGAGGRIDAIVLPKVQSPSQVHFVDQVLTQLEMEARLVVGGIGLELQIEDALGLLAIKDILAASGRTETVILGPGDMSAALGMPGLTIGGSDPDYPGDRWQWVLATILVNARAAGVQAIDGPYARIRDLDGFRDSAKRSRALGYDGKWVIHPDQIDAANAIYGINQEDFERAADILDAYEQATDTVGDGATLFGDEMIDEATRKMAAVNHRLGLIQGLTVRYVPSDVPVHRRASHRASG